MKMRLLALWILLTLPAVGDDSEGFTRTSRTGILTERIAVRSLDSPSAIAMRESGEVLLSVDLRGIPMKDQEVLVSRDGEWQRETTQVAEVEGARTLAVRENEFRIVRPAEALSVSHLSREKNFLPGALLQSRRLRPRAEPEVIHGELFVQPTPLPLRWDPEQNAYVTKLLVGLDAADVQIALDSSVMVRFLSRSAVVRPDHIELTRTGVAGYREVELLCLDRDQVPEITVRSDLGEVHYEAIDLDVRFDRLEIKTGEDRLLGLGLGTTGVTVERLAQDGRALSGDSPLMIHLTAHGGGRFSPDSEVSIPAREYATTVQLRSRGLGERVLSASSGTVEASIPIQFTFPVAFLMAVFSGGAAGGYLRKSGKKDESGGSVIPFMLEGCLVGLVAVAAVTAGLVIGNFPTPALGTELGAFLVAAISGYYGAPLMNHMVNAVFRENQNKS